MSAPGGPSIRPTGQSWSPQLPSILWQSINRFIPSRDVVVNCARVNRSWRQTAQAPFSTKQLPADDDHSTFMSSRSGHIWPWMFNVYSGNTGTVREKLTQIVASPMLHQVRVWPMIPFGADTLIDIQMLAQLKHIHTLQVAPETEPSSIVTLFQMRPFPFVHLHSLSLPYLSITLAREIPVLCDLRRLSLTERIEHSVSVRAAIAPRPGEWRTPPIVVDDYDAILQRGEEIDGRQHLQLQLIGDIYTVVCVKPSGVPERRHACEDLAAAQRQFDDIFRDLTAQTWTTRELAFEMSPPRYHLVRNEAERISSMTKDDWLALTTRMPRLVFLDLPVATEITAESGVLEFIRRSDQLRQVEGRGLLSVKLLTEIVAPPTPSSLECIRDCAFIPSGEGWLATYGGVSMDDAALELLTRIPTISRLTQDRTALTSLMPLKQFAHLKELTIAHQPLTYQLGVQFGVVFPELSLLESLTISSLRPTPLDPTQPIKPPKGGMHSSESSSFDLDAEREDDTAYTGLMAAIKTLKSLKRLKLESLPMLPKHLDALLGATPEPCVDSLDDEDQARSILNLTELNLSLINLQDRSQKHLFRSFHAANVFESDRLPIVDWKRLENVRLIPPSCKLTIWRVFGISDEQKAAYRAHFARTSKIL